MIEKCSKCDKDISTIEDPFFSIPSPKGYLFECLDCRSSMLLSMSCLDAQIDAVSAISDSLANVNSEKYLCDFTISFIVKAIDSMIIILKIKKEKEKNAKNK